MKQTVRRDALAGITEYYTDETTARTKEQEDAEAFAYHYYESLKQEWAEERRTILQGYNPATGRRYTLVEFEDIVDTLELTQDELLGLDDTRLSIIGDENIDAMIAHETLYGY